MDQIKAMLDSLLDMRNAFDGYNEDQGFVYGSIEWEHSFNVDKDYTKEVEAYIAERDFNRWRVTYNAENNTLHVFASVGVLKRSSRVPRWARACTRALEGGRA